MTEEAFRTEVVAALRQIGDQLAAIRTVLLGAGTYQKQSAPKSSRHELMTAKEACRYLRRSNVNAFYNAIIKEQIPHRSDGRRRLFVKAELDQWLLKNGAFVGAGEPAENRRLSSVAGQAALNEKPTGRFRREQR